MQRVINHETTSLIVSHIRKRMLVSYITSCEQNQGPGNKVEHTIGCELESWDFWLYLLRRISLFIKSIVEVMG